MNNKAKGYIIASLVLGIVSCALFWHGATSLISLAASIVGLVFAVKFGKQYKSGMSTAALVLNLVGVSLGGLSFCSCGLCYMTACIALM